MEYLHYLNYPTFAAAVFATIYDLWFSTDYVNFATREGNGLWTDAYGFIAVPRSIVFLILFLAAPWVLGYYVPDAMPWLWLYFLIIAVTTGLEVKGHIANRVKNRAKQNITLDRIQKYPDQIKGLLGAIRIRKDRAFYTQFAFIFEQTDDPQRETKLIARILELSRTRAFPK